MSDMEDDFMCDDEEDYDLVFTARIQLLCGFCFYVVSLTSDSKWSVALVLMLAVYVSSSANMKLTAVASQLAIW